MTNQVLMQGKIVSKDLILAKTNNQIGLRFTLQNVVTTKSKKDKMVEIDCVAFNEIAEYIHNNFKHNDEIVVLGRLTEGSTFKHEIILFTCFLKK